MRLKREIGHQNCQLEMEFPNETYWGKFEDVLSLKILFFPVGEQCFEEETFDLE